MNRRPASLVALLVGLSLLTTTVSSFAQTKGASDSAATSKKKPLSKKDPKYLEAKRLFEKGEEFYSKGDYEKAIESWELSYDLTAADLILESIANAYERLGQVEKAREYLGRWREAAPEDERPALDERLSKLDARIAKMKATEQERLAREKAERDALAKRDPGGQSKPPAQGLFVPGIIIAGVGGAAAITGGVLDFLAYRGRPDQNAVCAMSPDGKLLCRDSARAQIEKTNTLATVGDIALIAGGVIAAGGVVLTVLKSGTKKKDEAKTAVVPLFLPGGGGVVVGGRF
ncbi:MAG TPA: hypothetical protein PK156_36060 [Polyangium sp.]|nr:hypothetical protein [Polyangium sp.]